MTGIYSSGNLLPSLFGATLTAPHASSSFSLPPYSPRPGWGPIVCAQLSKLWGPSAHFPRDAISHLLSRAGERLEDGGPALQLRAGPVAPPSALEYAGQSLLLRRWDRVTGELVKGLGSVPYRCLTLAAWPGVWAGRENLRSTRPAFSSCGFQSVDRETAISFDFCNPFLLRNHSKQTFQEKVTMGAFSRIFPSPC